MSELAVGSLAGLAANSYVIDVASGSQLTQPGMVLQVVQSTTSTSTTTSSTSYVDTALSATITPSSSSSKILIIASAGELRATNPATPADLTIFRGNAASGTDLAGGSPMARTYTATDVDPRANVGITYLDSPATTSATTYTLALEAATNANTVSIGQRQTMILMEIAG